MRFVAGLRRVLPGPIFGDEVVKWKLGYFVTGIWNIAPYMHLCPGQTKLLTYKTTRYLYTFSLLCFLINNNMSKYT